MKNYIITKLKADNYVTLKVIVNGFQSASKPKLQICSRYGVVIEEIEGEDNSNESIQKLQLQMIQKAGEYQNNKGLYPIIDPFTN